MSVRLYVFENLLRMLDTYNTCFALSILNPNYYHFTCPRQIFLKSKTNFPKKGYKNLSVNVND